MPNKSILLCLIGLLLLTFPLLSVTGNDTQLFLITDLNAETFPEVQVNFRVVDSFGKTVGELTEEDLSLYENNQPISDFQLTQYNDAPVSLIYLIDLGQYTNYNAFGLEYIRRAIAFPFLNGYFQDGKDTIQLKGRANDGQLSQTIDLFKPSNDGGAFLGYVNSMSFNPSSGQSDALRGIEDTLDEINSLNSSTSLVFLTHLLDTLSDREATAFAEQLAVLARERRVSIYTFQTRIGGADTQALTILSEETGGEYLRLMNNEDQRNDFKRIFEEITSQRTRYSLTYRSTSSQSGNREVSIGPAGSSSEQTTSSTLFAVDVLPPRVEILSPADDSTLTIEMLREKDGQISLQPDTLSISAQLIEWPDGYPRYIRQAKLFVNDVLVTQIETEPTETTFNFTWTITDIQEEGLIPVEVKAGVVDELGVEAESTPTTINLDIFTERTLLQSCLEDPSDPPCLTTFLLPLLVILTLFVVAAIVLFFIHRKRTRTAAFQDTLGTPRGTVLVPGKREKIPTEVLARLRVMEGPPQMLGLDLEIHDSVTILGRDPDQSTISFFPEGNTSISGKHCTLQLYSGTFYISDNHSMNGTTLNDEVLEPDKSYELKDGDVIELGDLSVRGVKLKLTILKTAKGHAGADATLYGEREESSSESPPLIEDG